jgi:hypothetical protein
MSTPRRRIRRRTPSSNGSDLTFPAHLIQPPQSQLTRYEDAVADRIRQLDAFAQRFGEAMGLPYRDFLLDPVAAPTDASGTTMLTLMLRELSARHERVSLERRNGRWGLYFTKEPAIISQDRGFESILLKDAPLDVREKFLGVSGTFFEKYLELCEDRLGSMKAAVGQADTTIERLLSLKLV